MSRPPDVSMPASADPIPFPRPVLYDARRITGLVTLPETRDTTRSHHQYLRLHMAEPSQDASIPPTLKRENSMAGNILVVELPEGERAYWLQRKICKTTRGSVRVGFVLQRRSMGEWTVQPSDGPPYPFEMVAIKIQEKAVVEQASSGRDPTVEFSALQMMAETSSSHVVGTRVVCTDNEQIYIIMPYHGEGSLFEYVVECGRLSEGVARHFFRQIISGLSTMREVGLCHRDLSLENVLIRGTDCYIVGLGLALRMPPSSMMLAPQTSCGSNLLYLAPEIVNNDTFDGYAVDLWAAGVMLTIMLFGTRAPFVWASPQDKRYREIAIKGNLRRVARKWGAVSDEALDLVQNMLRANPGDRLTLEAVQQHPWFVAEATAPELPSSLQSFR